jgi:DNA mismatch endonuclease, patch repair protein
MSRIRGRDTGPELELRRRLWRLGFRYRLGGGGLPGRPDIVFPRRHLAVFVDGCFWHSCPRHRVWPKTRAGFWRSKLQANQRRDLQVTRRLRASGWRVVRIWEHELGSTPRRALRRVLRAIDLADSATHPIRSLE